MAAPPVLIPLPAAAWGVWLVQIDDRPDLCELLWLPPGALTAAAWRDAVTWRRADLTPGVLRPRFLTLEALRGAEAGWEGERAARTGRVLVWPAKAAGRLRALPPGCSADDVTAMAALLEAAKAW